MPAMPGTTWFIGITTCERPLLLCALLDQLIELEHQGNDLCVYVIDDATNLWPDIDMSVYFRRPGWKLHRHTTRFGKERFWQTYSELLGAFERSSEADYFVSLPDDCRLSRGFLRGLEAIFYCSAKPDAINFHRDLGVRSTRGQWGTPAPTLLSAQPMHEGRKLVLEEVGWVDGFTAMHRSCVEALGYVVTPPARGWRCNSKLGSGVGAQITLRLRDHKMLVVRPRQSLVKHLGGLSVMNPAARIEDPLSTADFIDELEG